MGICCSNYEKENYQTEIFMYEVLKENQVRSIEFSELKEIYEDIAKEYFDIKVMNVGSTDSSISILKSYPCSKTITRGLLFQQLDDLLKPNLKSPYKLFNKKIFNFNDQYVLKDDPEFYFYTYCFSLCKCDAARIIKSQHLLSILEVISDITVSGFIKFINLYLHINLFEYTHLIYLAFKKDITTNTYIVGDTTIDHNFYQAYEHMMNEVFNEKNINEFAKEFEDYVQLKWIEKKNLRMNSKIDINFIDSFVKSHDFFTDCILLRKYFFKKYVKNYN